MEHAEEMNGRTDMAQQPVATLAQTVCDYIAGMTDRYAVACFDRHFVPKGVRGAGSV
jgi:dGTPase